MSDEFNEVFDSYALRHGASTYDGPGPRPARLVSRLYGAASLRQRASMLTCLLRPLGTLGLAAVASGAFAGLLGRDLDHDDRRVGLAAAKRYSNDQIFELARFVEQVNPDALTQFARLVSSRSIDAALGSAQQTVAIAHDSQA